MLKEVIEELQQIDFVQWVVLIFGVAEVLLAKANNILLYPAGIISSSFAMYGLFEAELFAECGLNFYYVALSIYGWWFWLAGKNKQPVTISCTTKQEWIIAILISLGGWLALYSILITFTPSKVPLWDAWVSASAWAGTWLLARRKLENWILLNVSNAFAIPLLFYKNLPLFAILTIFLFVIACLGYMDWRKELNNIVKANASS